MTVALTEQDRADVEGELELMREAEEQLQAAEPVSADAAVRKADSLERLRGEKRRLEQLLGPEA